MAFLFYEGGSNAHFSLVKGKRKGVNSNEKVYGPNSTD
jgi:hypothetical protein